jgi:hypothetical protein
MRKIFFMLLALPFIGIAQNKNLINATRYFPKTDKVAQFEKALATHAQKFHKGDQHWRVWTVETGPDAGAYMVVEGPTNWDGVDKRGDLGDVHMKDWQTTVQPLLNDKYETMYLMFREELSTVVQTDYADKISINHLFIKPGYRGEVIENLQAMKKLWQADGASVAVYDASSSGEPQFVVVTRYKKGLKERDVVMNEDFAARFTKANGAGSFEKWLTNHKGSIVKQWSEILYYKPDIGSK